MKKSPPTRKSSRPQCDQPANAAHAARTQVGRLIVTKWRRAYFRAQESFGVHKRDILLGRVEEARDSLDGAKEQFQSALDQFSALTEFNGGVLELKYRQLKSEFERSRTRAQALRNRIRAVESVSEALFGEWQEELECFNNRTLYSKSRQQLKATHQHYTRLIAAMKRAEGKIYPVLSAFEDQVLFLKHNLNAQAIASLHGELLAVGMDIAGLIKAMEKSIAEANTFLNSLNHQRALPANL